MTLRAPALALILIAAVFAYGCEKKGPAEKAGEKIDHAYSEALEKAEEAGEQIEEAGERIEEALQGPKKPLKAIDRRPPRANSIPVLETRPIGAMIPVWPVATGIFLMETI